MTEKPIVSLDVVAKVESTGSITSNMADVQKQANAIKEWYANLVITEDDVREMKKEKALISKLKDAVASYRKNIVAEFKKPINEFEETAKQTEKTLREAYDSINDQISVFEEETRMKMVEELRSYFNECKDASHLDWLEYERMRQNVMLSGSMKKMKAEVKDFVSLVDSHLQAIRAYPEEQQAEMLVEYKRTLNFTDAVITVTNRHKAMAEEKARQEALKALEAKEEKAVQKVEEVTAPVEVEQPKIYAAHFTVRGTIEQLKRLKEFMDREGIAYDTGK